MTTTKPGGKPKRKKRAKIAIDDAAKKLAQSVLPANPKATAAYPDWQRYLGERVLPIPAAELFGASDCFTCWGVSHYNLSADTGEFIRTLRSAGPTDDTESMRQLLAGWCQSCEGRIEQLSFGLEAVALAYELPSIAGMVDASTWQDVFETLNLVLRGWKLTTGKGDPWKAQLIGGELPIALAYTLPEFSELHEQADDATSFIDESIDNLLDGSGMPEATRLDLMRPLLATWIRSLVLTKNVKGIKLAKRTKKQIDWLVRHCMRITRRDGSQVFSPPGELNDRFPQLIDLAANVFDDAADRALAKALLKQEPVSSKQLPENPAYESEWAGVAVLQPEWSPSGPRLVTTFRHETMQVALDTQGHLLFSGSWNARIQIDGEAILPTDEWGSVCWFSDFDVDYLELEIELTHGWRMQRQFLMARQDCFLYTADILLGPEPADIDYCLPLPLCPGIRFDAAHETREGFLANDTSLALLIPLAAPEWKTDSNMGGIQVDDCETSLVHSCHAQRLYCPMFIDLHPRRLRKSCTWRSLAVGEALQAQPKSVAAGCRIHVGPEQWLAYRSLATPANRTVLGKNLTSEFLFARFLNNGDTETLVEIE